MSGCARKTLCYRALRLPPGVPDLDRTGVTTTSRAWVFHHCGKVLWIRHGGSVLRTRCRASLGACPGARSRRPSRDHDRHVVRRRPRRRAHRPGPVARGAQPAGQGTPAAQSSSSDRGGRRRSRRSPRQDRTRGERSPAVERRRPDRRRRATDPEARPPAAYAAVGAPPPVATTQALVPDRALGAPGLPFPNYTFDAFVPGPSNRFAHAAAMAVAEAPPSTAYNPLFIYGGVGSGKTHLLIAVGHHMYRLAPALRVKYVTSEQFVTEFIKAVRERQGRCLPPALPRGRCAAGRRHPVPGQARGDPDRVLPHVQPPARRRQADRDRVRSPAARAVAASKTAW